MPTREVVLTLDVGTSSCRAILYDLAGNRVRGRTVHIGYTPKTTADGGAELDADQLTDWVCAAIEAVLDKGRVRVVAIATSTFWHSLVGIDAAARALTPVYLWLDARSREDARRLRSQLDPRAVHARTGCVLHWSYWPAKLSWLRRTQPELFGRVERWVSFGAFLLERLTGLR